MLTLRRILSETRRDFLRPATGWRIVGVSPRTKCRLSQLFISGDTCLHMESEDRDLQPACEEMPTLPTEDAELEREFEELAQWLLDVYLWRLEQERKTGGSSGG